MNSNGIWTVRLASEAAKQLERVPRDRKALIRRYLREMEEDPFRGNVKPLKGKQWKGRYRKVVGQYRIIFVPLHQQRIVEVSAILIKSEKTYR